MLRRLANLRVLMDATTGNVVRDVEKSVRNVLRDVEGKRWAQGNKEWTWQAP